MQSIATLLGLIQLLLREKGASLRWNWVCTLLNSALLVGDDFIRVEDLVDYLVERFLTRKVLVVKL